MKMSDWMRTNRLQLNTAKTEILWGSTTRRQNRLPSAAVPVGENHVLPSATVRDLGIFIDNDVAMRSYVSRSRTVSGCFAVYVPFAGRFAGYATARLLKRYTCQASGVPASSTSVGAQRRRQTDTSILSV